MGETLERTKEASGPEAMVEAYVGWKQLQEKLTESNFAGQALEKWKGDKRWEELNAMYHALNFENASYVFFIGCEMPEEKVAELFATVENAGADEKSEIARMRAKKDAARKVVQTIDSWMANNQR